MSDLRYACRTLLKAPAFTFVAVATLAIGVAVNTVAFTVLNALMLRPMPVRDSGRVVRVYPRGADGRRQNLLTYREYVEYRSRTSSLLDGLIAYVPHEVTIGGAEPRDGIAYAVSVRRRDRHPTTSNFGCSCAPTGTSRLLRA